MKTQEEGCVTTALDSEQAPADCSQVEPKQLEINNLKDIQGLLIANGALRNIGLENDRLGQGNVALLSKPADRKLAECILFSNKLTEKMLGDGRCSDSKLSNGSRIENMKLVESMNLNNKPVDVDSEARLTDTCHSNESPPPPPLPPPESSSSVRPETSTRGRCFTSKFREEFGFLLTPDFLVLSVSFLFLAYGCSAPVVYLVPYALSVGVKHKHAAFLMSIFGISGIVGNITFGWITDRK